jgi:hypothetical protein
MSGYRWRHTILLSLLAWSAMTAAARAEVTQADRDLVDQVKRRLLAVTEPVAGIAWPPTFPKPRDDDEIQAFAYDASKDNQVRPEIVVYTGLLHRVVQGNADRLAFILGHELGHVILKHIQQSTPGKTDVVKLVFTREQEIAADAKGMELTLAAGYSKKGALGAIRRFIDLDLDYSSFEGLGKDHPSWKDRIALLDKEQAPLWHAMAAFHDGIYFLVTEQYGSAERCFRAVTREFPACHEAWANLGYALLMRYCDGLEVDDLRPLRPRPVGRRRVLPPPRDAGGPGPRHRRGAVVGRRRGSARGTAAKARLGGNQGQPGGGLPGAPGWQGRGPGGAVPAGGGRGGGVGSGERWSQ